MGFQNFKKKYPTRVFLPTTFNQKDLEKTQASADPPARSPHPPSLIRSSYVDIRSCAGRAARICLKKWLHTKQTISISTSFVVPSSFLHLAVFGRPFFFVCFFRLCFLLCQTKTPEFSKSNQNAWVGNAQALVDPRKKTHPSWDGNAIAPTFRKQKREHFRHIRSSQRHRCHNTRHRIGQVPYSLQHPHSYMRCTPRVSQSNLFFPKEKTKIITTRKIGPYNVGQSSGESHPIEKSPWCHQDEIFYLVEAVRRARLARIPVGWTTPKKHTKIDEEVERSVTLCKTS